MLVAIFPGRFFAGGSSFGVSRGQEIGLGEIVRGVVFLISLISFLWVSGIGGVGYWVGAG